jgi:hypothetical protein
MKKGIFLLCLLLSGTCAFSQKKAQEINKKDLEKLVLSEDSLAHWARIAVTNSILDRRIEAQDKILPLLRKTLAIPNSFNYPFSELENVSITYPQDRSFRILTWQLMHTDMNYQYFGFIQLNSSKSIVYELKDFSKSLQKPESQITTQDKWFGALYYSIRDFKTKDGEKYLLFGLNSNDTIEKIKLCDVLTLRGGQVKFGAPVFEKHERGRTKMVNRLMMYHAKDAAMRFNYDAEMDMIVHDHLTDVPSPTPKVPFVSVPDGTYEAYTLKKGIWQHIDKLATTEMDEAPIPKPVLGKKAKVVDKENAKNFYGHEELPQKATEEKKKETKQ